LALIVMLEMWPRDEWEKLHMRKVSDLEFGGVRKLAARKRHTLNFGWSGQLGQAPNRGVSTFSRIAVYAANILYPA